jgi:hypothetical protein
MLKRRFAQNRKSTTRFEKQIRKTAATPETGFANVAN